MAAMLAPRVERYLRVARECGEMIVRTWRGHAPQSKPEDYPAHFNGAVLPELRNVPGFVNAMLLRRETAEGYDFLVVTTWESLEAIKSFAGAAYDRAVVEPGAVAALAGFDDTVDHYELLGAFAKAP
jgi:heme-degrading monooxygenase HmoA